MNQHALSAPSSIPSPIIECTGAQAGLSGLQQLRLILETLVANEGTGSMAAFYAAVEAAMQPRRLSTVGKAAVRCYVNRRALAEGLLEADTQARIAAVWRITPKGRALVEPVPRDRPRVFAQPMLRALGKLSGHTLEPVDRPDVLRSTLAEAGYDPDHLPLGWNDLASNGQPQIMEALRSLARSMSTLITRNQRNTWSLTRAGLDRAAEYNGVVLTLVEDPIPAPKKQGPNLTSQWLTKHLTPIRGEADSKLMTLLKGALTRHMRISVDRGLVEDHIQNFMIRVIRRDSFAATLAAGEELPYTKVASYCVNSSRSDVRDMGTDPVCREMMGARTDKERRQHDTEESAVTAQPANKGHYDTDGNVKAPAAVVTPVVAPDFETVWRRVEETASAHRPHAWKLYAPILQLKAEGFSIQEIATQKGITRKRASKMLSDACQLVRDTCTENGEFQF